MNNQIEIPCDEEIENFLKEVEIENNPDLGIERIQDYYTITENWGDEDETSFAERLFPEVNTINFIKTFNHALEPINNFTSFNICCPLQTLTLKKKSQIKIDSGICIEFPPLIYAKLEISKELSKYDVFYLGSGIIDSGYRGSLIICLENLSNNDIEIKYGQPIAEMILKKRDDVILQQSSFPKTDDVIAKKRALGMEAKSGESPPPPPAPASSPASPLDVDCANEPEEGEETETASEKATNNDESEQSDSNDSFLAKKRALSHATTSGSSLRATSSLSSSSSTDEYETEAICRKKIKKSKKKKVNVKTKVVCENEIIYSRSKEYSSRLIRNNPEDVCFDITTPEPQTLRKEIELKPNVTTKIFTGLYIKLPANCIARILDRSSLAAVSNVRVVGGTVIQPSHHKFQIVVSLRNEGTKPFFLFAGRAFAQILFERVEPFNLRCVGRVEFQKTTVRGTNGFGSTDASLN